jgi:WD40 repeat protein
MPNARHYQIRSRSLIFLTLLSIFGMAACSRVQEAEVAATQILLPAGLAKASSVFWFANDRIVVGSLEAPAYPIWYRPIEGAGWQQLALQKIPECTGRAYLPVATLPDGRLGISCPSSLQGTSTIHYSMMAYDWESGILAPLLDTDVLPGSGSISWRPDMQRGIFSTSGAYSTLYWLSMTGTQPVTLTLTDGVRSWALPDSIRAEAQERADMNQTGRELHQVGNVGAVRWSPLGDRIAFWATLETIGQPYELFRPLAWDIYVMDAMNVRVERLVQGVYQAGALQWSSDGQWLAYTTAAHGKQPQGLWLFSLQTHTSTLVREGHYTSIAWSPDGLDILALRCLDSACDASELWQYDLSTLVAQVQ